MNRAAQLSAVARYEFLMQVRKRSLWISMAALTALMLVVQDGRGNPLYLPDDAPGPLVLARWAVMLGVMLPMVSGSVLADRVVRDRRIGTARLFDSLPLDGREYLAGKYLGGTAATGLPMLGLMLLAGCYEGLHRGSPAMPGWALAAFALVTLPGLLFVAGFALTCPVVLGPGPFRVLFVGYWAWANLIGPDVLPTTSGSLLAPIGDYAATWLAGERALYAGTGGFPAFLHPTPTARAALASATLLAVVGLLPLLITDRLARRRDA